ncbi:MAG: patatin-like phospholipase family protein [Alkalicoccus sp.]|nr:MAG: patatin-like phospholipase family protein [Alkalicoccus sp.]
MEQFKLSFSGGGFRAAFFCLGAYRRLVELGVHKNIKLISSVSGGSITAAVIMMELADRDFKDVSDFDIRVTEKLKAFGKSNFRNVLLRRAVRPNLGNFRAELLRARNSRLLPEMLNEYLFYGMKLTELPEYPVWICNATNLQTLKRISFSRTKICDEVLGDCLNVSGLTTAEAVAASSAFPVMFEPVHLDLKNRPFDKTEKQYKNFHLTDGGVYDNLGSEELLDRGSRYMILDASARLKPWDTDKHPTWRERQSRIFSVSLDQVAELRKKLIRKDDSRGVQLVNVETIRENAAFQVEYWESRGHILDLPVYPELYTDIEKMLAALRTDLDTFSDIEMRTLMWAGAVRADLGIKVLFSAGEMPATNKRYEVPLIADYTTKDLEVIRFALKNGWKRRKLAGLFQTDQRRTRKLNKTS